MSITTTEIFITNPKVKKKIAELFEKKEQRLIDAANELRANEDKIRAAYNKKFKTKF